MLKLEWALFSIRSLVNAVYSLANFQGFNNMVSQWSPPLGKISGKHSPFPATFRPSRLQFSCWQLFAQSPTAVTCPAHQTMHPSALQPVLLLCTALTRVCIICSVSPGVALPLGGNCFQQALSEPVMSFIMAKGISCFWFEQGRKSIIALTAVPDITYGALILT